MLRSGREQLAGTRDSGTASLLRRRRRQEEVMMLGLREVVESAKGSGS